MKPNKVAIVGADWPIYEKFCPNFTGMMLGLEKMGIENEMFSCRPELNIDALVAYKPDLVVYGLIDMVKNNHWRREIRVRLPKAKIVMWYGDLRNYDTGQIEANMGEIDAMFVSNDEQSGFYKRKWGVPECHFLPLGSPIYKASYNPKYDFDFVFIGGLITGKRFFNRASIMMKLRTKGLTVIDAPARKDPVRRAKVMKAMPDIYKSSKASLDWSHFTDIRGYTSNRFWIITAAGGLALTKRWPGCEEWYPEGTRVYFDSVEECLELADFYKRHPKDGEKIRLAGYQHAIHHTYEHRFKIMFDKIYG